MRITGRIVDAEGRPVDGAIVYGEPVGPSGYRDFETTADEEGKFSTVRLADTDQYGFYARSPGKNLAACRIIPTGRADFTIELEPAATVVGYVYDAAGKPVESHKVTAIIDCSREGCSSINVNVVTDKDGQYRIPGLAVDSRCRISVRHEGLLYGARVELSRASEIEARDVVLPSKASMQ
jgi:hypothetical protein